MPGDLDASPALTFAPLRLENGEMPKGSLAATMARRDLPGFASFVDDEAVFFSGPMPLRGRDAVVAWWARYFGGAAAPFSWEPDQVVVLASGALAHSSGPVRAPDGKPFARFDSIWRRQADGAWKIVFDKGSPLPPRAELATRAAATAQPAAQPSEPEARRAA